MIRRFYVHNFRCLENFELPINGHSSVLLIGNNGTGKTTVGHALQVLQSIARGTNRIADVIKPTDFPYGRFAAPMRFELEVELEKRVYKYEIALELPEHFREPRVLEEKFLVDGKVVYARESAHVRLVQSGSKPEVKFSIDWHVVALPVVQQTTSGPLRNFQEWLRRILILRPIPNLIRGDFQDDTLEPNAQMTNFGAWLAGLLALAPSSYTKIENYLREVMPDIGDIKNPATGVDSRRLEVQFLFNNRSETLPFDLLSDGEKCFMIFATVIAANAAYGPLLCYWDEPDNYLAPSEAGPSIMALRRSFEERGQLIMTSHNPEAIRRFSEDNTLILSRKSHLEPTTVRTVEKVLTSKDAKSDYVDAIVRGDLGE
jgi:ABC-type cobalamin/Fe3+-siderophores transport system ATPase subunit